MTDIQQRIADVLGDQWTDDIGGAKSYAFSDIQDWADHVAEVLVSELGLKRVAIESAELGIPASVSYMTEWVAE